MSDKIKTLAIFTLLTHKMKDGKLYGYSPYINEINMWASHFDRVLVVGYYSDSKNIDKLESHYSHTNITLIRISEFNIKSFKGIFSLMLNLPITLVKMIRVMKRSDHFHFRCPSNVSAIAAVVQVFYPKKKKTTKYAGNWDPNSNQPLGYKFQKWLLSHSKLTKNMKLLVYGEWDSKSPYVVPFMSATYKDEEKVNFRLRDYKKSLKFVFIGAMVVGKRPLLTVQIIEALLKKYKNIELHMFGDGPLMTNVKSYISQYNLEAHVFMYGNQPKEKVKEVVKHADFTILPSKSEGWPKAIAEGMFFGAIPISTKISCLPWILDYGNRGILIDSNIESAVESINANLELGNEHLNNLSKKAMDWSQQFTVDRLEFEIKQMVMN